MSIDWTMSTGAKMTMMSWSRVIDSLDAVPDIYKSFFKSRLNISQAFPFTVLAPSLDRFLHKTTEKLVCEIDETVYVLENKASQINAQGYPLHSIRDVEMGSILLQSWMTISGVTDKGTLSSATIDFNTSSGDRCFVPFLNKMRPAPVGADEPWKKVEQEKFDYLSSLNFKFMNYGRSSLVNGEKVTRITLQPEIREHSWSLFGWKFYRTVSLAHVVILTDKELILICDDERGTANKGVRYGGIWRYIPLRNIVSLSLKELPGDLLKLSIALSPTGVLDKIFSADNKYELEQLQSELQKLTE